MRYHTVLLDKKEIHRKLLSPRSEKMETGFQLNELKILCNKTLYHPKEGDKMKSRSSIISFFIKLTNVHIPSRINIIEYEHLID